MSDLVFVVGYCNYPGSDVLVRYDYVRKHKNDRGDHTIKGTKYKYELRTSPEIIISTRFHCRACTYCTR